MIKVIKKILNLTKKLKFITYHTLLKKTEGQMNLRTIHRRVALVFSPFFIITSLTGIALLFRKNKIYSKEVKELLIGFHNWELATNYLGAVLGLGLLIVTVTGILLFLKTKKF